MRCPPSLLSKLAANHAGDAILRNRCSARMRRLRSCLLSQRAGSTFAERAPQCSRAPSPRSWHVVLLMAGVGVLCHPCGRVHRALEVIFFFQSSPHFHLFSTPHQPWDPKSLIFLQCLVAAVGRERCVCRPVKCHGRNKRKGGGRERKSVQMFFISLRMRALCTTVACMCDSAEEKTRVHE